MGKFADFVQSIKDKVSPPPTMEGKEGFTQGERVPLGSRQTQLLIPDANFERIPDDAAKAAEALAKTFRAAYQKAGIKIEESAEFRDAGKLDGKSGLSDKEIAAMILARSMDNPGTGNIPEGKVATPFYGELRVTQLFDKTHSDPKVVFELAKQILGDKLNEQVSDIKDTKTVDGGKPYVDAALASDNKQVFRC